MESSEKQPTSFFVYGSLKRGYLRETIWPHLPEHLVQGTVQATLLDLGPYPGIQDGEDLVLGEVWSFAPSHMADTISAVDEAEGYNQPNEPNYYERRIVTVMLADQSTCQAYAYFIGSVGRERESRRIQAWFEWNHKKCAVWPDPNSRVPRTLEEE